MLYEIELTIEDSKNINGVCGNYQFQYIFLKVDADDESQARNLALGFMEKHPFDITRVKELC